MLQIQDIRQRRLYQEAKEEGLKEGTQEGLKEGIAFAIVKLAAKKMRAEEIAATLEMDVELVRQTMKDTNRK